MDFPSEIPALELAAQRLRRRVFAVVFVARAAQLALVGLLACGSAALLARYAFDVSSARAASCFAPLALVPFVAWWRARGTVFSHAGAVAWLDVHTGAGGALLTQLETDDVRWRGAVERAFDRPVVLPRARLARPLLALVPALAFALAALFVPFPRAIVLPPRHVEEAAITRVEEKLAALAEEVALEPELAAELEARLERLKDESGSPEDTFEALDQLTARLDAEGERLGEELRDAREALQSAAETAASDPDAAQRELEQTLGELARAGLEGKLANELLKELGASSLELPPGTELTREQMNDLARSLDGELGEKLAALERAGLAGKGLKALGKLGKAGELAKLDDFEPTGHVCDERCEKKPGGT